MKRRFIKGQEPDFLDELFASTSDVSDEAEVDIPLVDVPENLGGKLYAIAESEPESMTPHAEVSAKWRYFYGWPKATSIAVSVFVAVMGFQFYQQQQTIKQLEQAQADLATALHYLGEANRITQAQVLNSLSDNINNAGIKPAIEHGRDPRKPNFKLRKTDIETPRRTL